MSFITLDYEKALVFLLILFSCNTQDFIISSTYQHWIGGRLNRVAARIIVFNALLQPMIHLLKYNP